MAEFNVKKANKDYLLRETALIDSELKRRFGDLNLDLDAIDGKVSNLPTSPNDVQNYELEASFKPKLEHLCRGFALSAVERQILLLCVGWEIRPQWSRYCQKIQDNLEQPYPSLAVAAEVFPDFEMTRIDSQSPLIKRRLIAIENNSYPLAASRLKIERHILHYLLGDPSFDERLSDRFKLVTGKISSYELSPTHEKLANEMFLCWRNFISTNKFPVMGLCGTDVASKWNLALEFCSQLDFKIYSLSPDFLPTQPDELETLVTLWLRESRLNFYFLALDCEEIATLEPIRYKMLLQFLEAANEPIIVTSRERFSLPTRQILWWEVSALSTAEQHKLWRKALPEWANSLNGSLDEIVTNFQLNHGEIKNISTAARTRTDSEALGKIEPSEVLWELCRTTARPRLDELAQRIETKADWDDLILPERQKDVLRKIAAYVRNRTQVYEKWGFARKGGRGLGLTTLFAGTSGTGKTLAAEVVAKDLKLDLYRIDLSSVVSKYIGETEKNLAKLFAAAETGGVILLFDEGESLFGKRSEVKDSRDRYANLETSYLLQRLEAYRGLAIITTNIKDAIDSAFVRRLGFIVDFPFPTVLEREQIWRQVFTTPKMLALDTQRDYAKLAQLNVSGGSIRAIARDAAFIAADNKELVSMKYLLQATKSEYLKTERTLTEAEIYGWV